jgi:N6-adenosine-specific RNA methylase IME4
MELDEIKALDVPAADDSVLFLWATSPKLAEALEVMDAWGFTYRTCMVWVKDRIGMGYYARQKHELLLVGARGSLPAPEPENRPSLVFESPRGDHSKKPDLFYQLIETMYPEYDDLRMELFARQRREGWEPWGFEASAEPFEEEGA